MNSTSAELRLQDAWRECERHVHHLFYAMAALKPLWPFTADKYGALTDEQVQDMDQFILRFTKLQDTMGERFLPAILQYLQEPYDTRPMLDKLNRLEKLGFIESVEKWQQIRSIRNRFAHDYPDDPEKNAAHINLAFETALDLYQTLAAAASRLAADPYSLAALGNPLPQSTPDWIRPGEDGSRKGNNPK